MTPPCGTNSYERGIRFVRDQVIGARLPSVATARAWCRVLHGHYKNFPLFFVFMIIRTIWVAIQWVYWKIIGFKPLEYPYETSAQVLDVLWSVKPFPIDEARPQFYMLMQREMAHPSCVLSDNCMLLRVWREYAVFVDFGRPIQDNFTVKDVPFLWDETVSEAKRIILMPIPSMHRVSMEIAEKDRIENRANDLSLLFGTGRCGSTLITRIVEMADPNCLVLSEPVHLIDLYRYYSRIPTEEYEALLLSSTRLICKPLKNNPEKRRIFIKPLCFCLSTARSFNKVIPGTRILFCHRDALKTSWAHERAFGLTICYRAYQMAQWVKQLHKFEDMFRYHRNPRVDEVGYEMMTHCGMLEMCIQTWAAHYLSWAEQKEEFNFPGIFYDDVFKEPVKFVRLVLELSGYSDKEVKELLPAGLKALDIDSQSGKEIGQKQLQGYPVTQVTPELKQRVNRFFEALDLPKPSSFVSSYLKQQPPASKDSIYENLLRSIQSTNTNGVSNGVSNGATPDKSVPDFLSVQNIRTESKAITTYCQ